MLDTSTKETAGESLAAIRSPLPLASLRDTATHVKYDATHEESRRFYRLLAKLPPCTPGRVVPVSIVAKEQRNYNTMHPSDFLHWGAYSNK